MPLKSFRCSICGKNAPKSLLEEGKFKERMHWLLSHRKDEHPKEHNKSVKKSAKTKKSRK